MKILVYLIVNSDGKVGSICAALQICIWNNGLTTSELLCLREVPLQQIKLATLVIIIAPSPNNNIKKRADVIPYMNSYLPIYDVRKYYNFVQ